MKSTEMVPRPHQVEGADWALDTIGEYGIAYLSWKERTGKTLTALLTVENSIVNSCLIVTKKKALPDWNKTLDNWQHSKKYVAINYESVHKITEKFDFIILDEAHHAISSIGKPSKTWRAVKKFTLGKPILYLSATPYSEHVGLLYHQFKLSNWCPFKYKNFYDFYRTFGIPNMKWTPYGMKDARDTYRTEEVLSLVEHLFSFKTRADVGIEIEPTVNVIKVEMSPYTKELMREWKAHKIIDIDGIEVLGDSDAKIRAVHYQLEGSTIKQADSEIMLKGEEKVNFIKNTYDTRNIAIMAHFIAERKLLKARFPNALILSSDGDAEGIDLSHIDKLVIYSMSFRTSKYTQRIARQANHNRVAPIVVDILVADKPGVGLAVYEVVAKKEKNFTKDSYERMLSLW